MRTEEPPVDFSVGLINQVLHPDLTLDLRGRGRSGVARHRIPLSDFGCLPLIENNRKGIEGEWLTVIQHPEGKRKQVCVRENQLMKRDDDVLWYTTDTQPGSSGSPVFNNDWYVVALHHAGVPEKRNGEVQKQNSDEHK